MVFSKRNFYYQQNNSLKIKTSKFIYSLTSRRQKKITLYLFHYNVHYRKILKKKKVLYVTFHVICLLTYLAETSKSAVSVFPEKNPPLNESCCHWPLVSKKGERLKPLLLYSKHKHKHSFKNKRMGSIIFNL